MGKITRSFISSMPVDEALALRSRAGARVVSETLRVLVSRYAQVCEAVDLDRLGITAGLRKQLSTALREQLPARQHDPFLFEALHVAAPEDARDLIRALSLAERVALVDALERAICADDGGA